MNLSSFFGLAAAVVVGLGGGCSANSSQSEFSDLSSGGSGGGQNAGGKGGSAGGSIIIDPDGGTGDSGNGDMCAASAKYIYVVSVEKGLYAFDPGEGGLGAYHLVGTLNCPSTSSPQSMSVSSDGTAWVFYSDGHLFKVSTQDASCQATSYVHPVQKLHNTLGMGFTAVSPGSMDQILYIVSPDFGLATIELNSLAVNQTGKFIGTSAELTGGPDGKLFIFAADNTTLSEVALPAMTPQYLKAFPELQGTSAWAFARYAGKFYLFTSIGGGSRTTVYDPQSGQASLRDADIGFMVVGAGQSICVPPPPTR